MASSIRLSWSLPAALLASTVVLSLLAIIGPADAGGPTCFGQPATRVGTSGRDVIDGGPGADVIVARGGNDDIDGGGGNDRICGGPGNDEIGGGAGHNPPGRGRGQDEADGGAGE